MEDRRLMTKRANIDARLEELEAMDLEQLRDAWRRQLRTTPPRVSAGLLRLALAHAAQEEAFGGLPNATRRPLRATASTGRPLPSKIGRAHVCTPVTHAPPVCRHPLGKKKTHRET